MKKTFSFLLIFAVILNVIPAFADSHSSSTITAEVLKGMNATFGSSSSTAPTVKAFRFMQALTATTCVAPVVAKKEAAVAYVTPPKFSQQAVFRLYSGNFDVYENYSLPMTMGLDLAYDVRYENQGMPVMPYLNLHMYNDVGGRYTGGVDFGGVRLGGGVENTSKGVMAISEIRLYTKLDKIPSSNGISVSMVRADLIRIHEVFRLFVGELGIGFVDKELFFLKPINGKLPYIFERGVTASYIIEKNLSYQVYLTAEGLIDYQYKNVYSGEVGVNF